jgi:hypothetical protein
MAKEPSATRQDNEVKRIKSCLQFCPFAALPTELKLMIIRYVHVATVSGLTRVNKEFWSLRGSLGPTMKAAARMLSSGRTPKPSIRMFERVGPDDTIDRGNGQFLIFWSDNQSNQSYWKNVKLGWRFQGSPDWNDAEGGVGAESESSMSVAVWPTHRSRPDFLGVPELRNPKPFGRGRLCLGYEKIEPGSWNLVVR